MKRSGVTNPLNFQRSFDDYIDDRGVPLAETTFCILDFETTGGNRTDDRSPRSGS